MAVTSNAIAPREWPCKMRLPSKYRDRRVPLGAKAYQRWGSTLPHERIPDSKNYLFPARCGQLVVVFAVAAEIFYVFKSI